MFGDDLHSLVRICGYCYLWVRLGLLIGYISLWFCYYVLLVVCNFRGLWCVVASGALFWGLFVWFDSQVWCWA